MSKSKVIIVTVLWAVAIIGSGAAITGIYRSGNDTPDRVDGPSTTPSTQAIPAPSAPHQPLPDDLAFKAFQDLVREFDK